MSLSQWDMKYLNPEEQAQVLDYQKQWQGADANTRVSLNNAANTIRGNYGYTGGVDGSQFSTIEQYKPPTIPNIQEYDSQYDNAMNDVMKQIKNPPKYVSPYEDLINESISNLINRDPFSYNADEDAAYQAYKQRALAAGDKAYADNLGGMSAMTGGRSNSWAGTVASQARNAYVLESEMAVIQFEDRAYSRYQNETQEMYNLVGLLNTQDQTAYNRFRDEIGDTKDYADMIMRLDDRDYSRYQQMVQNTWNTFSAETEQYEGALNFKKNQMAQALDRTNLNGYVNNQDSVVLGVSAGTLSQGARERVEAMEDYIRKAEIDLKTLKQEKQIQHEFDLKLLNARESYSTSSGGSYSGGTSDIGSFAPSSNEIKTVNTEYDNFNKWISSDDFKRMTVGKQYQEIQAYQEQVISSANSRLFGDNSNEVGALILNKINAHPTVSRLSSDYKKALAKVQGNSSTLSGPRGGTYAE